MDQHLRDAYGPPGAYDRRSSAGQHLLLARADVERAAAQLGDDEFCESPVVLARTTTPSVTRDDIYAHWEKDTGLELSAFFDALDPGTKTPRVTQE